VNRVTKVVLEFEVEHPSSVTGDQVAERLAEYVEELGSQCPIVEFDDGEEVWVLGASTWGVKR
jgi:hypothetical protein